MTLSDCLLRTINTLHFALSLNSFSRHFLRRYSTTYKWTGRLYLPVQWLALSPILNINSLLYHCFEIAYNNIQQSFALLICTDVHNIVNVLFKVKTKAKST